MFQNTETPSLQGKHIEKGLSEILVAAALHQSTQRQTGRPKFEEQYCFT
jgi:hypothetical protein